MRAVPRRLQLAQVIQHPPHGLRVERLADHDAGAARAHGEHRADPCGSNNLIGPRLSPRLALASEGLREADGELRSGGQRVLALVQHADQLVHVVGAEGGSLAERHGVEREALDRRRRLINLAKAEPVCEKRGHVSVHRLRLRGGELQLLWDHQRLPVQRRGALKPFKVVNLVGRVLIHDEQVVAQRAQDEPQVELADDFQVAEVLPAEHALQFPRSHDVAALVQLHR